VQHAGLEGDELVAAALLGLVHRDVGVAHDVQRRDARLGDRDADAGRDVQRAAVDRERAVQRRATSPAAPAASWSSTRMAVHYQRSSGWATARPSRSRR
jgi:hypothetical protein